MMLYSEVTLRNILQWLFVHKRRYLKNEHVCKKKKSENVLN